jgi:6-phosphogluconolactonase/glucosamine-6-phosphate isomerase/deaminase
MSPTFATGTVDLQRHARGENVWLRAAGADEQSVLNGLRAQQLNYRVLDSEEAVGRAMLDEIIESAGEKSGDLTIVLLGGRGAQALHRLIGEKAKTDELDTLLARLNVFTQDALAPMRADNPFSFVRDFERLLGPAFFKKVRSFNSMNTEATDLEAEFADYLTRLEQSEGIDIFFLGLGPEANAASHLCYIRPGSGATAIDIGGMIPISPGLIEHHITKFKAGGAAISETGEQECRNASHILTLGPAPMLRAKKIVQSIVDADTAPAKVASFKRLIESPIAEDGFARAAQVDENPGLWIRLHDNVRSYVLSNVVPS